MKDSKPDAFLDGKISLFQPLNGYRANSDSILLAAAVDAKKGQSILELGCGVGAVLFSLMSRVDALKVVGIEIQRKYAQLAVRNAEYNGFEADILECDITEVPHAYKQINYNHVVLNPPFFNQNSSVKSGQLDKDFSKRESGISLSAWLNVAIKRCAPKGDVVIMHRATRLPEILKSFDGRLGDIKILPISSFEGTPATRIIIKGKKGSASPLNILAPFVLHEVKGEDRLAKTYTVAAERILRKGHALEWI